MNNPSKIMRVIYFSLFLLVLYFNLSLFFRPPNGIGPASAALGPLGVIFFVIDVLGMLFLVLSIRGTKFYNFFNPWISFIVGISLFFLANGLQDIIESSLSLHFFITKDFEEYFPYFLLIIILFFIIIGLIKLILNLWSRSMK